MKYFEQISWSAQVPRTEVADVVVLVDEILYLQLGKQNTFSVSKSCHLGKVSPDRRTRPFLGFLGV
jgi:hypothetical protein